MWLLDIRLDGYREIVAADELTELKMLHTGSVF